MAPGADRATWRIGVRADLMLWSNDYLGLPWQEGGRTRDGISCWGLAALVYVERRGLLLPDYSAPAIDGLEWAESEAIVHGGAGWPWREVEAGQEQEFDLVTFRLGGFESHVGIVTRPGSALHVAKGLTSHVVRYDEDERWNGLRGRFLRHGAAGAVRLPERRLHPASGHGSRLVALPGLDPLFGRIEFMAAPGLTVADMVAMAFPGLSEAQRGGLRVTVDGLLVPQAHWDRVKPKEGRTVLIRVVPGAGLDTRTILLLAVTAAAIAVSAGTLGPAGLAVGGELFAAGSTSAALASGALLVGGSLLINALVPAKSADQAPKADPTYAINGFQNQLAADGVIPSVLGKIRFAPPYAALPYTEVVGNSRYIVAAFLVGYGQVAISGLRLGRTPIDTFSEVQYEVRQGLSGDAPITLYPNQVLEEAIAADLIHNNGPQTRLTAADVNAFEVEIYFPGGLYAFNHDGHIIPMTVQFQIRYRVYGTTTWTTTTFSVTDQTATAFWRASRITPAARGQYEVEVSRTTLDLDDLDISTTSSQAKVISRAQWSVIRGFRPEYPFNFSKPMALIAVRIKATGQLNGTLDNLNLLASRVCPDWTGSAWVTQETQNPASLARYVQQGPENAFPLADADLDLTDLQTWAAFCTAKGLAYNRVHDFEASRDDVLRDVCGAGRALPRDRGDQWTVIIDKPRTEFIDHISPRNSWGYSEEYHEVAFPHAYRVKFKDETADYVDAERVVPWPGHGGDITIVEQLELPGKTDPDEIWIATRRRQYEAINLRVSYRVNQDFEHLVTGRGDGAYLSHDVLNRTQVAGRVRLVSGNVVTLDEQVTMVAGHSYQCRFRAADGTSVLRTVALSAGTTRTLTLTGSGASPSVGDLAQFGEVGQETIQVVVKEIEVGENTTGALTLIPHVPAIDTATDAEVPPAWTGRIGGTPPTPTGDALTPIIRTVASSTATGSLTTAPDIVVTVGPAANSPSVTDYQIQYRQTGAGSWSGPVQFPAGQGGTTLTFATTGFAVGTSVDIQARARGATGVWSAWSATTVHVVGSADVVNNDLSPQSITTSEALAAGDFVNVWNSSGIKARKANATAAGKEAHGYVIAAFASGAVATVYFDEINNKLSGMTPGLPIYLSTTGGGWTHTPPAGAGNVNQWLGIALSASQATFLARTPFGIAA